MSGDRHAGCPVCGGAGGDPAAQVAAHALFETRAARDKAEFDQRLDALAEAVREGNTLPGVTEAEAWGIVARHLQRRLDDVGGPDAMAKLLTSALIRWADPR